jgi:peptidoglycan/LPS O-acetylase OafA/YrhL
VTPAKPPSDPSFRVNNFDLLRILAASQVVVFHTIAHMGLQPPRFSGVIAAFPGVPVFFALSGYLISTSFERTHNVQSYARNRLLRIIPALWCVVITTVVVAALFGFNFLTPQAVAWFFTQLVGLIWTPHFLRSFGFGSYNGALWTIPIELQFYFLLPILYAAARSPKNRTALFGAAWLAFTVIAYLYARTTAPLAELPDEPLPHKLFRYSFVPHIYLFLSGVLLQRLHAHRSRWIAGKGLYWLAAYIAVHYLVHGGPAINVAKTLLMTVTVISLAFTAPRLAERILRGNDISYGVYIYHGLVINVLLELGCRQDAVWMPVVFVLTFALGWLSWVFVERPFLKRKKNSIHPATVAAAAPDAGAPGPA